MNNLKLNVMNYNEESKLIINDLYFKMQIFMAQNNGSAELQTIPSRKILAYSNANRLLWGYEFITSSVGDIIAIRCSGANLSSDYNDMQQSRIIFGYRITKFDTSNYPYSVTVYIN